MSLPDLSLSDKTAVITGSRRGIGRAYALAFAEAGADMVICDQVVEGGELETVAEEIRKLGQRSLAVRTDITRQSEVDDLVSRTVKEFGGIDILVNNAGLDIIKPLLDTSEEEWDTTFAINLKGQYLCAKAAARKMIEQKRKGSIINIASHLAFKAATQGAYCIAKSGVVMLTRVLARELGGYNIRANAIAPGMVLTKALQTRWHGTDFLEQRAASLPLGRIAAPADMVGAALFLASDASDYITGQTIIVDGGHLA